MPELIVLNVIHLNELTTLNSRILNKDVLIDLHARNFVHAKTLCVHDACKLMPIAHNLSRPEKILFPLFKFFPNLFFSYTNLMLIYK